MQLAAIVPGMGIAILSAHCLAQDNVDITYARYVDAGGLASVRLIAEISSISLCIRKQLQQLGC